MDKSENTDFDDSGNSSNSIKPEFSFSKNNIGINDILDEANKLVNHNRVENEIKSLLKVKTASEWLEFAKTQPIPRKLFGVLWHEGEVAILFADTNLGKSILAVQIADSISRGIEIQGFSLEAEAQHVNYFDFELMAKQFEARYSEDFKNHYIFHPYFLRSEFDPDSEIPEGYSFEEFLYKCIEVEIIKYGSKILIIDNITYLKGETEKAKDAAPLMKALKKLKNKYGLSILVLAHTPKRDLTKPITRNDLSGSKMLMNFCDSSFAIGESNIDKSIRYIKQVKARYTEIVYDTENVALCQIEKPSNFLGFKLIGYGSEYEHLKHINESDRTELENQVRNILANEPGISPYKIAQRLCPDESKFESFKVKIYRLVKKIRNESNNGNNCS